MPTNTTGNLISAVGAATATEAANRIAHKVHAESLLSLPWKVIGVAAVVSGLVAVLAAANRRVADGDKLHGWQWKLIEFFTGVVAGAAVWALTDFMNPDPKLQLVAAVFAGWQARSALDKYLPEFWRRITGSDKGAGQ